MGTRKTNKYDFVNTCFGTHHPQFGFDATETLWTSGGGPVVGWVNTKMFDATGDSAKSQGWTALILDTNGNGKRDDYVEPNQPVDPAKDKRIVRASTPSCPARSTAPSGARIARIRAPSYARSGSKSAAGRRSQSSQRAGAWLRVRGGDIDSKGVVWCRCERSPWQFDRTKCKGPLNGPKATGDHCLRAGRSISTGTRVQGIGDNSAESSYYSWARQHNHVRTRRGRAGVDRQSDRRLIALEGRKMVTLRVPYPWAYAKGPTVASTIPIPAGRDEDCGPRAAIARRGVKEGGRELRRLRRTSSCARTAREVGRAFDRRPHGK